MIVIEYAPALQWLAETWWWRLVVFGIIWLPGHALTIRLWRRIDDGGVVRGDWLTLLSWPPLLVCLMLTGLFYLFFMASIGYMSSIEWARRRLSSLRIEVGRAGTDPAIGRGNIREHVDRIRGRTGP